MSELQNVTVTIDDGLADVSVRDLDASDPRSKNIVTVNAVRLASSMADIQEVMGDKTLGEYIKSLSVDELMALRAKEPITCENETALVVPHGNAKAIAADKESALIVSVFDQGTLSLDFCKKASGRDLKNFFNAIAEGMDRAGLSLDGAFIVMHVRMKDKSNTVSPQPFFHAHVTDKAHINSAISEGRYFVPNPKGAPHIDGEHEDFTLVKVAEDQAESAGHKVMSLGQSWGDLMRGGSEAEWEAWRDAWVNDADIVSYAENGGLRIVIEDGVMSFHGGEPLYQGDEATPWHKAPAVG